MSTIPKIPPPPLIMNLNPLLNTQSIKKKTLKSLNLTFSNNFTDTEIINSIFKVDKFFERKLNISKNDLKEYFQIEQLTKVKKLPSKKSNEPTILSCLSNKNKYTTAYVLCKKYNMESFLNNLYPTFIEKESNQNSIEKDFISFIIDYEILFTISQIFPTEKECNEILNLKISKEKLSSINQIDYLFLTLSTVPKFKIYIDNLLCLTEVKGDILEYSKYLKAITGVYIVLINSMNIKNLINIILSIANEINLINYQNKISYFDIKSLENVIYMKNKSKKIFDLICKYYYQISNGESILNSNTKSNIEYIINKLNSNQEKNSQILKDKFNQNYEGMLNSICEEKVKEELKKIYIDDFYESIFNNEVINFEKKENEIRIHFKEYFLIKCNDNNYEISLLQILNTLIKIDDNLKEYAITNMRPIKKRKIEKNDNKENKNTNTSFHKKNSSISLISKENNFQSYNINNNLTNNKPYVSILSSKYNL